MDGLTDIGCFTLITDFKFILKKGISDANSETTYSGWEFWC